MPITPQRADVVAGFRYLDDLATDAGAALQRFPNSASVGHVRAGFRQKIWSGGCAGSVLCHWSNALSNFPASIRKRSQQQSTGKLRFRVCLACCRQDAGSTFGVACKNR
jgi:hypothetical protein